MARSACDPDSPWRPLLLALLFVSGGLAPLRSATLAFQRSAYRVAEGARDLRVVLEIRAPECGDSGFQVAESTATIRALGTGSARPGEDFRPLVRDVELGGSRAKVPVLLAGLVIDGPITEAPETFQLGLSLSAEARIRCLDEVHARVLDPGPPATVEIDDDGEGPAAPETLYAVLCDSGCAQAGKPGAVTGKLRVRVVASADQQDRPVAHVPVFWSAAGMPVQLDTGVTYTGEDGRAEKDLTLGPKAGAAVVSAGIKTGSRFDFKLQIEESPPPDGGPPIPGGDLCRRPGLLPDAVSRLCRDRGPDGPVPREVLPDEVNAQANLGLEGLRLQRQLVLRRLASHPRRAAGGAPGADSTGAEKPRGLGVYAGVATASGGRSTSDREAGYDDTLRILGAGADRETENGVLLGGAVSYAQGKADFDDGGGSLDLHALSLTAYAAYGSADDSFHLEGILTWGRPRWAMERVIDFGGLGGLGRPGDSASRARSNPEGRLWGVSLGGGGGESFGRLRLEGRGYLSWQQVEIDPYDEHGAGDFNLAMSGQRQRSLLAEAGLRLGYERSFSRWGLELHVGGSALRELGDGSRPIEWRFAQGPDPQQRFFVATDRPDRDYLELEGGIVAKLPGPWSTFLSLHKEAQREDFRNRSLLLGVVANF